MFFGKRELAGVFAFSGEDDGLEGLEVGDLAVDVQHVAFEEVETDIGDDRF